MSKQCLASTPSISSPAGFCLLEQQKWKRVFQPKVVLEREGQDRETLSAEDILLVFHTGLALSTLEMPVYECGQWQSSQQQQPLQEAINLSLSLSLSVQTLQLSQLLSQAMASVTQQTRG